MNFFNMKNIIKFLFVFALAVLPMAAQFGPVSGGITTVIKGGTGTTDRTLKNSSAHVTVDWQNQNLKDLTGTVIVADWQNLMLGDLSGLQSVDWANRTLFSAVNEAASIDWENRKAFDQGSSVSLDWNGRFLYDDIFIVSVDWLNRRMTNSGSVVVLDWSGSGIFLPRAAAATSATTGTMTVIMTTSVITITPSGDCTFNASGGTAGDNATFIVTTSGASSRTLTFGTNFKSTGTLATGVTTAKTFTVSFVCKDGTTWCETSRTTAM